MACRHGVGHSEVVAASGSAIDFHRIGEAVDSAGYRGFIEIEIFNQEVWDSPLADVVARRYHREFRRRRPVDRLTTLSPD